MNNRFPGILSLLFLIVQFTNAQPRQLVFENYNLENGLQNNIVQQAFQDSKGYLWFATSHGISRFDGYRFTAFRNEPGNVKSLSGLLARVIYEDRKKNLWIGTESGGLNRFDRKSETFEHVLADDSVKGIGTSVKSIAEDKDGRLWLGTNIGLKSYFPGDKQTQWYPFRPGSNNSPSDVYVRVLQFDNNGKLWVGTKQGLDLFDPATRKFQRIYEKHPLLKDEIWEIYLDPKGMLWIGTYNQGLFTLDPNTQTLHKINLGNDKPWSNTIKSVVADKQGLYWIGSRAGLYVYDPKHQTSTWFGNEENEPKSLIHSSILNTYLDAAGNIWISTRGGISMMASGRQVFKHYKAQTGNSAQLNNKEVYAAWADPTGNTIWIGTGEGGVNILDRKKGTFSYLVNRPGQANSIAGNGIKSFMDDGTGNLWIGTYKQGISVYHLKSRSVKQHRHQTGNPTSLSDNTVWAMHKDRSKRLWLGTDAGLDLYDPVKQIFIHQSTHKKQQVAWIDEDSKGRLWLGLQSVVAIFQPDKGIIHTIREQGSCFYEDSKGRYWLATRNNGLAQLDKNLKAVKYYDEKDGLPNNQVYQLLEDRQQRLWMSTANGLAMFEPETETFTNYDKADGLQSNQFHYGAAYKLASGELIFGGINGFNIFDPSKVKRNAYHPPVTLTNLKIFNKNVQQGDDFDILKVSLSESRNINIPYAYNFITFDFAALNFIRPEKNSYRYKLVGFDRDWNEAGHNASATYTNLDPGQYTFQVLAANNDRVWNKKPLELQVNILPPFWKTWWFRFFLLALSIGTIYVIVNFLINRQKIKQQLYMERSKSKQMNEMNDMKLQFFTNISHEIRTPLTLIIGPLERLKNTEISQELFESQVELMYRNANALLKLVNQLLDFRKLESGSLKLETRKGDLILFIRTILDAFTPIAEEKEIKLTFNAFSDSLVTDFDPEKLEKILNNLISNALKFTQKRGAVSLYITVGIDGQQKQFLEITVKDTGIGISGYYLESIFSRFFQVPENKNNGGTGIGLALTRELVKLHQGEIFVKSDEGKGSQFTVRLPLGMAEYQAEKNETQTSLLATNENKDELITEKILLIVENNADVRQFIREHFQNQFHILEAADGNEGLFLARTTLPDLILSDVMMPNMDGKELCRQLKSDIHTSHIPILLLTALSSKQHTIEGLSSGADDYIVKPFDITIVQNKIENLLALRESMRIKFTNELVISPTNIILESPDQEFLRRAVALVEENIADTELDIENFCRHMAVSRMQMYRKLSALTGMTIKEFIRDIRLQRAAQLLEQRQLNVSEIGYAVGFRDLSTFRKCFREKYGINASAYLQNLKTS